MFNQDLYLGGKVVGIGKTRKDGSFEYKLLKKPIHNRIVSKGIDNLLTYQGDDALPDSIYSVSGFLVMGTNWYNGGTWGRGGPLTYSAVGDDDTPTKFTDTDLGNRITEITKISMHDTPYCGTKVVGEKTVAYRVTHRHDIVDAGYVKEIGWYKDVEGTFELFSRVVLDYPIEVDAGEQLWITYELDFTFAGKSQVTIPGILDKDGNTLQAEVVNTRFSNTNVSWTATEYTQMPVYVTSRVYNDFTCGYGRTGNWGAWSQAFTPVWTWHTWEDYRGYSAYNGVMTIIAPDAQIDFTGDVGSNPRSNPNLDFTNQGIRKVHHYTPGSFYRDATINLGSSWPSMSTEEYKDISQIIINSTSYKFGHFEEDPDTHEQVWVPQYFRKYRSRTLAITFRQAFHTPDTP